MPHFRRNTNSFLKIMKSKRNAIWNQNPYTPPPREDPKLHTFLFTEEMFSSNQGLWWSPEGKYVAYVETNDTDVHAIEYSWYGENQYPSTVSIPYPKVGLRLTLNKHVPGLK